MSDKRISQLVERIDIENNDVLPIVALGASTTNKVTISTIEDWMQTHLDLGVTSVGITKTGDALAITGSPITSAGNINIAFAGTSGQYVNGAGNLVTFPSLTGYVPYTGATGNVNLGEYGLTAGYLGFDLTPTGTPTGVGTLSWDSSYRTLQLIDGDGDTTLQIGQEERVLVHNNTGSTLTDGQVVYITGSTGELPSVALASNTLESTSSVTLGVVTESIANGADGFVTTSGIVHGLNTLAFTEGSAIWLGATAGTFTETKPIAPNNAVLIGYIVKKSGGNGSIFVKIQNGYELEELHDVQISSVANNQGIFWDSATSLWKNKTIASALGYTPADAARNITINGTTYNLTADRTWNVGTVTSVGLSAPTGFSVANSPITGAGTLALSFAAGYSLPTTASQANWNTAYNDSITSAAVTGTTTKTLTLNQQDGGTITASWTDINTDAVTSVFGRTGAVVATSGDYTTAQVTESGSLYFTDARARLALSAGTGISYNNTTGVISSTITQYTDAMARAAISLTTTGTSGAATYNNLTGVLNIPIYQGGVTSFNTRTGAVTLSSADVTGALGYTPYNSTNPSNYITLASLSAGTGISYNNTTGVITSTITQYTDALARASLSFVAGSGAYNSSTGVITIPTNNNQITNGAGYITSSALSAYLPLTGGTLTGALNGTSATFTGNVQSSFFYASSAVSYSAEFYRNNNADSRINITNTTTGTGGDKGLMLGEIGVNAYVYNYANGSLIFGTNSTPRLEINSSGNLGLGVTPSAWNLYKAVQVQGASIANFDTSDNSIIGSNIFYGGATNDFRYIANGTSTMYRLNGGVHSWSTAPSGTAGNAISFTQAMTLASTGNLLVGTTTDAGYKLDVNGTGRFSGNLVLNGTATTALDLSNGTFSYGLDLANNAFIRQKNYAGTLGLLLGMSIDNNTYLRGFSGVNIQVNNGTNALTLSSTGAATFSSSVGINGVSASYPLYVRTGTNQRARFVDNGGIFQMAVLNDAESGYSDMSLGNSAVVIKSSGNVGIGTSAPTPHNGINAFIIKGGGGGRGIMELWDGTSGKSVFQQVSGSTYIGQLDKGSGAGDLYFLVGGIGTSADISMTHKASGNVLIGTTTDNGQKLQLQGNARFNYSDGFGYFGLGYVSGADYGFYNYNYGRIDLKITQSTGVATFIAQVYAQGFYESSDMRLKSLIQHDYRLNSIASVKAKLYTKNGRKELGYYAQDVQGLLDFAVNEGEDGYLSLSYAQVHTAKIAVIEDEVTILKRKVTELESKLQKYEA